MSQDPSCSELAAANLCLVSPRHTQLPSPLSTGLEMNNTKSFDILPEIYKVTFENTKDFYKRGIPYTGTVTGIPPQPCSPTPAPQLQPNPHISPSLPVQMRLEGPGGSAPKEKQLVLLVNHQGQATRHSFLTDTLGRASFKLDTSGWTSSVTLRVSRLSAPGASCVAFSIGMGLGTFSKPRQQPESVVPGARSLRLLNPDFHPHCSGSSQ